MEAILTSALLGAIGGFIRGLVGISKALSAGRKIIWNYLFATAIIATLIGVFTVAVTGFDTRIALLAGYAGTDLLEGMTKSLISKKGFNW